MSNRAASILIITVSVLILGVVALLFYRSMPAGEVDFDLTIFPKFHAVLNSLATLVLLAGFYFIKNGKVKPHKRCMGTGFFLSAVFFTSYVTYHSLSEPTSYGGEGVLKFIYYGVLTSHILLAVVIVPLVLFTLYFALTNQFHRHKRLARWTLPIWLYVTITGVLVYVLISPYY